MIQLITIQLLYILATILMAGKDADSYLLKDNSGSRLNINRVVRWHRDGFLLAVVIAGMCIVPALSKWWFILPSCLLVRLSFFDILFNYWSGLQITYLGGTAFWDGIFIKLFGLHGAVRKSVTFFILLLALQYFIR